MDDQLVSEVSLMEFIVWVETRLAGNTLAVRRVTNFDRRANDPVPEDIGLTLQVGKEILKQVQRNIMQTQIQVQGAACSQCIHCRDAPLVKDIRTRQIRTMFGEITVACRRYVRCTCRGILKEKMDALKANSHSLRLTSRPPGIGQIAPFEFRV